MWTGVSSLLRVIEVSHAHLTVCTLPRTTPTGHHPDVPPTNRPPPPRLPATPGYGLEAYEEPLTECFDEYESYVDTAVNRLRSVFDERKATLHAQMGTTDAHMLANLDKSRDSALVKVDAFMNRTTRVTQVSTNELHLLIRSELAIARESAERACESKRKDLDVNMQRIMDQATLMFDQELESHQGRMSKRLVQVKETLNSKLGRMVSAREKRPHRG